MDLKAKFAELGASKTIYAWNNLPETKAVVDGVLNDREAYHGMFEESWTQRQDPMHKEFFDTWLAWAADSIRFNWYDFQHTYPTAGASEALREIIQQYGNDARAADFKPTIHVFENEYEGYKAYADAAHIDVVVHKREDWQASLGQVAARDMFFISQPSAIDGNVWGEYDEFMQALGSTSPHARVVLDLTYVGGVKSKLDIKADYPNISQVVFSLSKPFGVYYHRVGGIFSRNEIAGLWGNMWFKNVGSLKFGTELMRQFEAGELPNKYAPYQEEAAVRISKVLGVELKPSDVFLVATAQLPENPTEDQKYFLRGDGDLIRVCLTPMMARIHEERGMK